VLYLLAPLSFDNLEYLFFTALFCWFFRIWFIAESTEQFLTIFIAIVIVLVAIFSLIDKIFGRLFYSAKRFCFKFDWILKEPLYIQFDLVSVNLREDLGGLDHFLGLLVLFIILGLFLHWVITIEFILFKLDVNKDCILILQWILLLLLDIEQIKSVIEILQGALDVCRVVL